jgi:hypothetical protein
LIQNKNETFKKKKDGVQNLFSDVPMEINKGVFTPEFKKKIFLKLRILNPPMRLKNKNALNN